MATTVTPSTCMPRRLAMMTSGTVDIPATSPPSIRSIRTSAGVSKLGPAIPTYTTSGRRRPIRLAAAWAAWRRPGS